MLDMKTITQAEALAAILDAVRELVAQSRRQEERFDELAKTYLDSRFPHGKPTDRWSRGR